MRVHVAKDEGVRDYRTFTWARWRDGYQFEERVIRPWPPDPLRKHLLLSRTTPKAQPELYRPLDDSPGISREFAAIETPEGALRFANTYGLLGSNDFPRIDRHGAELVSDWLMQAQRLRQVYRFWDLCESKDIRGLGKMIRWTSGSVTITFDDMFRIWSPLPSLNTYKRGDVVGIAKLFIVEEYNSRMDQMASPILLLDLQGKLKPHISPGSLLAAIWLEFGELASGVRKQAACESCGRVMDVTGNRSHKRIHTNCSLRLRMARYRKKLAQE